MEEVNRPTTLPPRARRLVRWGKFGLQAVILAAVAWGIWRTVSQAQGQMAAEGVDWGKLNLKLMVVAGCFYLLGLLPCSLFWRRIVAVIDRSIPLGDANRAYYMSQLGKYVPGKVVVIVIRTAMVQQHGVNKTLTVTAIFVETLTMMSVGGVLGALLLAFTVAADWRLVAFGILGAIAVGAPTLPPVLMRIVKLTKLHRLHPDIDSLLARLDWRMLWPWWLSIAAGWVATGISLWAVVKGLPGAATPPSLDELPILIACVSLSTVVGFVSGLPGGLGPRDLVVMQLLQPHFGSTAAILAAIVHRCVMLAAEFSLAGVLLLWSRLRRNDV